MTVLFLTEKKIKRSEKWNYLPSIVNFALKR